MVLYENSPGGIIVVHVQLGNENDFRAMLHGMSSLQLWLDLVHSIRARRGVFSFSSFMGFHGRQPVSRPRV